MTRGTRALTVLTATALVAAGAVGCGGSAKKATVTGSSGSAASGTMTSSSGSASSSKSGTPKSGTPAAAEGGPVPASTRSPHAGRPKDVAVMTSNFGNVLNAPGGHALYVFAGDPLGQGSACAGACARKWPPFLIRQIPRAKDATQQRLLGMIRRGDGRLQATYAGRPLYFYSAEEDPGEILGQGVSEFGGKWWVVAPNGRPVKKT